MFAAVDDEELHHYGLTCFEPFPNPVVAWYASYFNAEPLSIGRHVRIKACKNVYKHMLGMAFFYTTICMVHIRMGSMARPA